MIFNVSQFEFLRAELTLYLDNVKLVLYLQ